MRVVVTGGSGLAGRAVVANLADHGYEVVNVDLAPGAGPARYLRADLTDLGQVFGCLQGAEAVVHLAAIPRPTYDVPEVVFRTNVMATFNVLQAAATLGVTRVVIASSVSVLGFPFFERPIAPEYVAIDEAHPLMAQDAYALSKVAGEELAAGFARRGGLSSVSLRFPWIHTPETFDEELRPLWPEPAAGASNLWSYIDTRDAAEAVRLALVAEIDGHEACFVAQRTPSCRCQRGNWWPGTTPRRSSGTGWANTPRCSTRQRPGSCWGTGQSTAGGRTGRRRSKPAAAGSEKQEVVQERTSSGRRER